MTTTPKTSTKRIKLTQGKYAIVDADDFDFLNQWKWKYHKDNYAVRTATGGKQIYMHREVNKTPKGKITDHINRNGLDNRRKNLRIVSLSQNAFNTKLWKHNTSGIKGVSWDKWTNRWEAKIMVAKKTIHLGRFDKKKDAGQARQKAEAIYAI